jgi:hypothetical protein
MRSPPGPGAGSAPRSSERTEPPPHIKTSLGASRMSVRRALPPSGSLCMASDRRRGSGADDGEFVGAQTFPRAPRWLPAQGRLRLNDGGFTAPPDCPFGSTGRAPSRRSQNGCLQATRIGGSQHPPSCPSGTERRIGAPMLSCSRNSKSAPRSTYIITSHALIVIRGTRGFRFRQ